MLVDSHCHLDKLDLTPYGGSLDQALKAAEEKGVKCILCVCVDIHHAADVLSIAKRYPFIFASFGIHPSEPMEREWEVNEIVAQAQAKEIVAIGETGLDYYHSNGAEDAQRERFRRHIRAARELNKPLIIHTRQAQEDTLAIMKEERAQEVGGVMHCFTETSEMALRAIDLGFYISFSGIITFKNAQALRDVVVDVPLDRLLIETDAPYLAPMPYRGKPNEPQYVYYVAQEVARLKQCSLESIAEQTTQNFFQLFKGAVLPNFC
ncbi:MAG: TatD family hydrolase [Gammaproteobacteria bacterium]|nr:TatD family hydrolase [Gammaproteobacteria bacterium]